MQRSQSRRSFNLDGLESRRMMAGDVAVAFDGQLMDIRGDALANQIVVSQNLAGRITVTGQTGTLVNGLPSVSFANGIAIEKLDILMEAGDDRVTINRLNVAGDINADLGVNLAGRDFLAINNSTAQGNVFAYGGLDLDTINMSGTTVFGDAIIDLAEGAGRSNVNNSTINGAATFIGGEGNDIINSTGLTVGLELKVETKQGDDTINLTSGSAFIAGISTDLGADRVTVNSFASAEDFITETGDGNDTVSLTSVNAGKNLAVNLDSGNDALTVASSSAGEDAILTGGAGVDTLTDLGLTAGKIKEVKEFEVLL